MREGNVFILFVRPHLGGGGGTPVPGSFPDFWSQVLSRWVPQSQGIPQSWPVGVTQLWPGGTQEWSKQKRLPQEWDTPLARTGVPHPDRLRCGRYASCGFPQEDFLVSYFIASREQTLRLYVKQRSIVIRSVIVVITLNTKKQVYLSWYCFTIVISTQSVSDLRSVLTTLIVLPQLSLSLNKVFTIRCVTITCKTKRVQNVETSNNSG